MFKPGMEIWHDREWVKVVGISNWINSKTIHFQSGLDVYNYNLKLNDWVGVRD